MAIVPQPQRADQPSRLDLSVRTLRIVHGALLVSIVLYVYVTMKTAPSVKPLPSAVVTAIAALAAASAVIAFGFRVWLAGRAEEVLATHPEDEAALRRWYAGHIVSFALAESVVLYGLVLKFIGAEWRIAAIFFAAGAALMLIFTPRRP